MALVYCATEMWATTKWNEYLSLCIFHLSLSFSPSFPFHHSINPVAYQQLLSQQRGLSPFGHTPPLMQPSHTFSSRQHTLTSSGLSASTHNEAETKVLHIYTYTYTNYSTTHTYTIFSHRLTVFSMMMAVLSTELPWQ